MLPHLQEKIRLILAESKQILSLNWDHDYDKVEKDKLLKKIYFKHTDSLADQDKLRILNELEKLGPIENLIHDDQITEILVNQFNQVIYEKHGQLIVAKDFFFSQQTYNDCIERLCQLCGSYINREKPFIETQIGQLRITIIYGDLARGQHLLSIRKQSKNIITLNQLLEKNWCSSLDAEILRKIVLQKDNFLVVGGTSSGKTTVLQALMGEIDPLCRNVIIEDTQELRVANELSASLLTRTDYIHRQYSVTMTDLLKRALRLRPDRLIVGEIRGGEATDLLMALSTGHAGSFGSLHAKNHFEALLRLEMLVQMGAPQWTHESIRNLIGLTIKYIVVLKKENTHRCLDGIYKLVSVEKNGITTLKVESLEDL